ncbi:uncharacterized protein C9orf85 homolog isoform X4 [Chiloscyllium plagiosum]|nr:uncharacterized protein C9orf85 homolog isoform X4 [Chiloscyllium plagiosum]
MVCTCGLAARCRVLVKQCYNLSNEIMSSQKGNVTRKRAQKHQNVVGFKNDKYDKSEKMKQLNAMVHTGVCKHCKEVLEWKIKYNKYKPLGQARK